MSKVTLDRAALRAVIDSDPDFELELKGTVLAEIGRRFFEKDAKRIIAEAEPELFAQALKALQGDKELTGFVQAALQSALTPREPGYYGKMKVAPDVLAEIVKEVEEVKRRVISGAAGMIEKAYNDLVVAEVEKRLAATDLDERIEKRVARLMDAEIDRRVKEKFDARMAQLREAMQ